MGRANSNPLRWKIFVLLAAGLLVVGLSSSGLLYYQATRAAEMAGRAELLSLVQMASLSVDADAHEKLTSPEQQDSPAYAAQIERLRQVIESTQNVRFVYTVRRVGDEYFFVLDPTAAGDADGDGVDDKSYLMDPMEDLSPALIESYDKGIPAVDEDAYPDRWGLWLSAYSPIKDKSGKVVSVLGIDRSYDLIQSKIDEVRFAFNLACLVVVLVSLGLAWIVSGLVGRAGARKVWFSRLMLRRPAIEFLLLVAVIGVVTDGVMAIAQRDGIRTEKKAALRDLTALTNAYNVADKLLLGTAVKNEAKAESVKGLANSSYPWLASRMKELSEAANGTDRQEELLREMRDKLSVSRQRTETNMRESLSQGAELDARIGRVLGISISLAALSLMILRYASMQDLRIAQAESDNSVAQAQYQTIVEKLPIGLFTYADGGMTYANAACREMLAGRRATDLDDDLFALVIAEDRDRLLDELNTAELNHEPLTTQARSLREGDIRHFEIRCSPVLRPDGTLEHLIGFTVDLTDAVSARQALLKAYDELESKNQLLNAALSELEDNLASVVRALVKAVEAKDPYTAGHSERVMRYSLWLGESVGLGPYEMRILELGTLVHDIGKIGIPDSVLTKPSRLTDEEFDLIKRHPDFGVSIIDGVGLFAECIPIVRWHHERLNGTGYPDGKKGDEIPYLVRIATIADIFDAMTSSRAYRGRVPTEDVLEHLRECALRGEIDGELVEHFAEVIRQRGILDDDLKKAA